jgi:hypothetical protein
LKASNQQIFAEALPSMPVETTQLKKMALLEKALPLSLTKHCEKSVMKRRNLMFQEGALQMPILQPRYVDVDHP